MDWKWMVIVVLLFVIKMTCYEYFITNKPTLYFIYVDWCGYCKKLKPIMKTIVDKYKNDKSINVMALNAEDANNKEIVTKLNVKSYPTILYFPSGIIRKEFSIQYRGNRTVEDIEKFLNNDL